MIGIFAFLLGFVTGYLFRLALDKSKRLRSDGSLLDILTQKEVGRLIIIVIVTAIWSATVLAELDPANNDAWDGQWDAFRTMLARPAQHSSDWQLNTPGRRA